MRRAQVIASSALILLGVWASTAWAQVDGRLLRVGLFAGASPIVRSGTWSFVEVELRSRGEGVFDGELHVDQFDRDGDMVTSVLQTPLPPDGQWHRYQVYFVPNDIVRRDTVRVTLFNDQGRLVKMLTDSGEEVSELVSDPIYDLFADEFLLVDLTTPRKLAHVAWLDSDRVNKREHLNARQVRGLSPLALPTQWEGLEAVDAIVWDNADPSALSQQQIGALINWVKAGGRLLITAGSHWQALASSTLAEALPVTITGVQQVNEAQEFTELVNDDNYETILDKQYSKHPIIRCRLSPLPIAMAIPADCDNPQIVYRRLLGSGSITFVGASLQELLPVPPRITKLMKAPFDDSESLRQDDFVRICEEVVGRKLLALAEVQEEQGRLGPMGIFETTPLFQHVRKTIGFGSYGAGFMVFAILFAIAYTLVATIGSYTYLKRRAWLHQCWIAFAAVGIAASVIGTGMVWTLRGVTTKVWQTTIVDGHSGIDYGHATCLFGVKTPNHTRIDLRLPVGADDEAVGRKNGPLRAMPQAASLDVIESRFAAPENYRLDVAHARLINVPVRATLKEFQGAWHGPLGGTLDAKLVAKRADEPGGLAYEFAEGSYIRNNLGVDLKECYIIETKAPENQLPTASGTHCFYLGDLPKSGEGSVLEGGQIRQRLFFEKPDGRLSDPSKRRTSWPRLDEEIRKWARALPRIGGQGLGGEPKQAEKLTADQEYYALLLLSVFNLVDHQNPANKSLRRSHGRPLDCTHWLSSRTAILIGWSDEPPPALLEIDRARYRPDKSRTIYRFVIPVERRRRR